MDESQSQTQTNSINEEIEEIRLLEDQLETINLPEALKVKAKAMVSRLKRVAKYGYFSREYEPIAKYVSWISQIPWGKYTEDNLDLENAKRHLDETHFGLTAVKERILEYIAMLHLQRIQSSLDEENRRANLPVNPSVSQDQAGVGIASGADMEMAGQVSSQSRQMAKLEGSSAHAPIICLVGVQGIGKTSIAKSISLALGKEFVRISLGGIAHVSELRGTSRSEVDSEPGQVVKALIRTNVMNPLILMDEIDKVSDYEGVRADVMASLLEILDPEQNATFRDYYIDHPVDLSKVMFICTANNLGGISAALLDRLEIVRMSSYTDEEKQHIAKDYLLPKVIQATGVSPQMIVFREDVWPLMIRPLGFDAGIRQLERNITTLVRKVAKKIVEGQGTTFEITPENFREYLPEDFGVYS